MLLNVAKAGETPVFFCLTTTLGLPGVFSLNTFEQSAHLYRCPLRAEPYFVRRVPWHFLQTFNLLTYF